MSGRWASACTPMRCVGSFNSDGKWPRPAITRIRGIQAAADGLRRGRQMGRGVEHHAVEWSRYSAGALVVLCACCMPIAGCGTSGHASHAAPTPLTSTLPPTARSARGTKRQSDTPGVVDSSAVASDEAQGMSVVIPLSTERYLVTRSSPEGQGDCGVTVNSPTRQFSVAVSGGVRCATAVRVVGLWSINVAREDENGPCYNDLCTHRFPSYLGFLCRTSLQGDSAWSTTCRSGRREISSYTAD